MWRWKHRWARKKEVRVGMTKNAFIHAQNFSTISSPDPISLYFFSSPFRSFSDSKLGTVSNHMSEKSELFLFHLVFKRQDFKYYTIRSNTYMQTKWTCLPVEKRSNSFKSRTCFLRYIQRTLLQLRYLQERFRKLSILSLRDDPEGLHRIRNENEATSSTSPFYERRHQDLLPCQSCKNLHFEKEIKYAKIINYSGFFNIFRSKINEKKKTWKIMML